MQSYDNRVYMHNYCSTFAYIQTYANTDVSFFWLKCVKLTFFFYFASTDVVALIVIGR